MKMRNGSHRYNINIPRSGDECKWTRYKKCLSQYDYGLCLHVLSNTKATFEAQTELDLKIGLFIKEKRAVNS